MEQSLDNLNLVVVLKFGLIHGLAEGRDDLEVSDLLGNVLV